MIIGLSCEDESNSCIHGLNKNLTCYFCQLEHRVNLLESLVSHSQVGIERLFEKIERLERIQKLDENNKPYKCPVCDGTGKHYIDPDKKINGIKSYYKDCLSCNHSGIIWTG